MPRTWWVFVFLLLVATAQGAERIPLGVVWVIRAGPLVAAKGTPEPASMQESWVSGPVPQNFLSVMDQLRRYVALAKEVGAQATILLSGDVAEEAVVRQADDELVRWLHEGFEIGTYVPLLRRDGLRRWTVVKGPARGGGEGYDPALARLLWRQHRERVDRLVGPARNRVVEPEPFRCSDEAQLAAENHMVVSFGRAGWWHTAGREQAPGPWHPLASDEPGAELAAARKGETALTALDREGQVGNPLTPAGDCSVRMLKQGFLDRLFADREGVRAWGFLTEAGVRTAPLFGEVSRYVRFLAAYVRGTAGQPRRARWSTGSGMGTALHLWERASGRVPSGFSAKDAAEKPLGLVVHEQQLEAVSELRSRHEVEPTTTSTLEPRWHALTLWRHALATARQKAVEAAYPARLEQELSLRMGHPDAALPARLDQVVRQLERVATGSH
jgi:hypothetical protein